MSQEGRAKQLEETLRDLAQWAGGFERSTMYPGAEVVDDSLSAERILVRGSEGYYEPALRMAGMTYTNGDLVTVLYIKGTEPIALAQGPGSGGTGLPVHDHSDATAGGQNLRAIDELEFDDASQLTIDGAGAITRTQVYHAIETNAGGATDNLDTINGGSEGDLLIIRPYHDGHTVVVRHNIGNIWLMGAADISLDDIGDHLALIYDATNSQWCSVGDGGGGGGAPVDAQYLTLALDGTLTDERRFVPGDGLLGTDGGAGNDYDLEMDIDGLGPLGAAPAGADEFALYDDTAGALRKVTWTNMLAGIPGGDEFFWWQF